jgi:uncharacterized RDD family membrane protein YckC
VVAIRDDAPLPPGIDLNALAAAVVARIDLNPIASQAAAAASAAAEAAVRGSSIGVFRAIASLLAVRVLLLLALVGGFALSWQALQLNSPQAVAVLIAYAVLVMIPLVLLERGPKGAAHARVE